MPTIDPTLYLKNQTSTRVPNNDLGKDDFLRILMAQLQNQDPTSPMEDREFISQLAQFSSLEQMTNMSNSINELVRNQQINPIIEHSHLIGKTVSYQNSESDGEVLTKTSIVTAVSLVNGEVILELKNGEKALPTSVTEIKATVINEGNKDKEEMNNV